MIDSYEDSGEWSHRESIADADRHEAQREEFVGEKFDHAELMWQRTVFNNVVSALLNGADQYGRDHKCYFLNVQGMQEKGIAMMEINKEAQRIASLVVG